MEKLLHHKRCMQGLFNLITESETQNYPSVNNYCSAAQHSYAPHCASDLEISGQQALAATAPMPLSPCTCILVNTYTPQHRRAFSAAVNCHFSRSSTASFSVCRTVNPCASEPAKPSISSKKTERRYHARSRGIAREGITRMSLWSEFLGQ